MAEHRCELHSVDTPNDIGLREDVYPYDCECEEWEGNGDYPSWDQAGL